MSPPFFREGEQIFFSSFLQQTKNKKGSSIKPSVSGSSSEYKEEAKTLTENRTKGGQNQRKFSKNEKS